MKRRSRNINILAMAATAALPLAVSGSAVRGGGGNTIDKRIAMDARKTNLDDRRRRPAIQDANQREKIRSWNERQLEELLHPPSTASHGLGEDNGQSHEQLPHYSRQPQHADEEDGQRQLYTGAQHKKSSTSTQNWGAVHVKPAADMGFQHSSITPPRPTPNPTPRMQQQSSWGDTKRPTPPPTRNNPPPSPSSNDMIANANASSLQNKPSPSTTPAVIHPYGAAAQPTSSQTTAQSLSMSTNSGGSTTSNLHSNTNSNSDSGNNKYYPLYTSQFTIGTCTNNGNEPTQYHDASRKANFLFDSLEVCCNEWYIDVAGCGGGFAYPNEDGELLKRNWVTGVLTADTTGGGTGSGGIDGGINSGMVANSASGFAGIGQWTPSSSNGGSNTNDTNNNSNSNSNMRFYYPSFDMRTYPDGACLNDGKEPDDYSVESTDYLFGNERECCREWFLDADACMDAWDEGSSSSMGQMAGGGISGGGGGGFVGGIVPSPNNNVPAPTPWEPEDDNDNEDYDGETPWPTWSDAFFQEDARLPATTQANNNLGGANLDTPSYTSRSQYAFYDSFEQGDFSTYDWRLPVSPSGVDQWEADRTGMAYEGSYAARPGVLSARNSQSNLTIALEGLDVSRGGLLTFAVHASVEMPVDALYFTINHEIIEVYDKVSGGSGDWEDVSVLLQPGQHTLTWSYQYYGMPRPGDALYGIYNMDPRRVGNSWVDAIGLEKYTGDVSFSDGGTDALELLYTIDGNDGGNDGMFELEHDGDAFMGSKSYVAYTQDIYGQQGSAEISWTIIAGPSGGILSFAIFASVYAPHDIVEFTVNDTPQVLWTVPSYNWDQKYIELEPGKSVVKWRLVKNVPGLSSSVINVVEYPEEYGGYVKVDGVAYVDNEVHYIPEAKPQWEPEPTTSTEATELPLTTSTELPMTTSTELPMTTTTDLPMTTTTDLPITTTEDPEYESNQMPTKPPVMWWTSTEATLPDTATEDEPPRSTTTEPPRTTTTSEAPRTTTEAPRTTTEEPTTTQAATTTPNATSTTTETPIQQSFDAKPDPESECPDGLQSVPGLPGCCIDEPNYLGDGACDPWSPYNTAECGYDLGDCCSETCNHDTPYGCDAVEGNEGEYGPFGFFCLDPRYGVISEGECDVDNREWVGDGGCDADGGYNTEACGWDMGDCCEETCDEEFSFYPCGERQPYSCLDPNAGTQTDTNSTGSNNHEEDPRDSPFYFHDGFESNDFDPLHWMGGDSSWNIEMEDPSAEGSYYAEARTEYIIDEVGESILQLTLEVPPNGGVLSYQVQALIQAPFEDVLIKVNGDTTSIIMNAIPIWTTQEIQIESGGPHVIQWVHRKNPSDESEEELASSTGKNLGITRIDDVTFRPH